MDQQQRKGRLVVLIERLRGGVDVARRDLKSVLKTEQFDALNEQWKTQKDLRSLDKPAAIEEYERRLQKALFEHGKAEGYRGSPRRKQVMGGDGLKAGSRAYRRAESEFERLLEFLEECVSADPGLRVWLDREPDFGPSGSLGLGPETIPRVITSRSVYRVGNGRMVGAKSKREMKLTVLEDALADIEAAEATAARAAQRILVEEAEEARAAASRTADLRKFIRRRS